MKILMAAVVAALVCAVLWFALAQPRIAELERTIATLQESVTQQTGLLSATAAAKKVKARTSVLKRSASACRSLSDLEVTVKVGDTIEWDVADFDDCLKGGWRLEYRFPVANAVDPPTPTGTPAPTSSTTQITATARTKGSYKYQVYRVRGAAEELLEDPELEIEPAPTPVGPGKPPD